MLRAHYGGNIGYIPLYYSHAIDTYCLINAHVNLVNDQTQGCKRDLGLRDRDETETFGFQSETRPKPTKISRDRDETETFEK